MNMNTQFFVFTPNPENVEMKTSSYCIDYMNLGNKWTATFKEGKFYHYKNGDVTKMHTDDHLDFDDMNGKLNRLEIKNGKMFVGPAGGPVKEGKMVYKGWDGKKWIADLIRFIDFHPDLNK
ncbi:hypothetical protein MBBAR_6c00740 [Methanobrevibacter arboriphilus JCM 13429 = DSM 1125]|uniref:Uncharacterized protein n=1 Tax=Methanobrevibacter arboriphilus JCM 13429 = DSM 1125 TaxID=1300164 RepID=A0A1V6N2T2_METAZ|nr:hypothetical protein [Methanobrevibacter arboriphilus]OQD58964.1 hypothetical protein MBBAR_6c00740 [Methanobrevibacter arboriphilus JCM 13429 = DSM 1125]